jgi:quercetin dioxygenase-like cupin family protein
VAERRSRTLTLVKNARLRLVLILMKKGAKMREHHVEGPISIWVVAGAISFIADGEKRTMGRYGLVVLDKAIIHDVEALDDESAFLPTIDQPILPK